MWLTLCRASLCVPVRRYNTNVDNEVRKSGDALRQVFAGLWSKATIDEDWAKYEALMSSDVSCAVVRRGRGGGGR